jgi:hypothetical protein
MHFQKCEKCEFFGGLKVGSHDSLWSCEFWIHSHIHTPEDTPNARRAGWSPRRPSARFTGSNHVKYGRQARRMVEHHTVPPYIPPVLRERPFFLPGGATGIGFCSGKAGNFFLEYVIWATVRRNTHECLPSGLMSPLRSWISRVPGSGGLRLQLHHFARWGLRGEVRRAAPYASIGISVCVGRGSA